MRLSLLIFFVFNISISQNESIFLHKQFIDGNDTLNYRLLIPKNLKKKGKYPLHLFLHGIGERGNDNKQQLKYIAGLFINQKNRNYYKSYGVFPQCPNDDSWSTRKIIESKDGMRHKFYDNKKPTKALSLVIKLMDSLVKTSNVNTERVYATGLSNGGMGTFEMLYRRPDMFAAGVPICGGANPNTAKLFAKKTPVWIFHGAKDDVVHPLYSVKMVEAIIQAGGSPKFTLYDNVNHDSWLNAFKEKDFFKWIYSQKKSD
jgi:predicted peptidase